MEVNKLLLKLKACGDESDETDLVKVYAQYKDITSTLPAKDKTPFSLNVLCILCRNIERVPSWSKSVKDKDLLTLTIECGREARGLEGAEEAKALAYIFHIHRHIIRKGSNAPPELLLKLSYMAFEKKKLMKEYYKTYWNIVADRMTYIERLKTKLSVTKLLPSLAQDILKIISIFEITQFCTNVLSYVVKKMYLIFSNSPKELNVIYLNIFQCISKTDVNNFKTLPVETLMDIYRIFNDCLCVAIENASKMKYKDLHLEDFVQTCMCVLSHRKDLYACFQKFYLSSFCCMFKEKCNLTNTVFNNLIDLCTSTENENTKAMKATYPILSQLLKIYIESGKFKQSMSTVKECFRFIMFLVEKLKDTTQLLKCEGCVVKTGLHDALRVTFLTKSFITNISNSEQIQPVLPTYYLIVEKQYKILENLKEMGCPNYSKCLKKLQADVHNTAILLHPLKQCEFSIKLFNIYLKNEVRGPKEGLDKKSISRAFYNKSISELDMHLLEEAMKSAYLSMIFALPESLKTQKYMDLVNNIKSLNSSEDGEKFDMLRCMTSLDVCKQIVNDKQHEHLKPVIQDVKFCQLLLYEHRMYMQHWPSVKPISGVCKSVVYLLGLQEKRMDKEDWIIEEKREYIVEALYEIIMDATRIRTFDVDIFKVVVVQLLEKFEEEPPKTIHHKLANAVLMFMKAELDLGGFAEEHGWNTDVTILDPDKDETDRTLEMEHKALKYAIRGVEYMTAIQAELHTCSPLSSYFTTAMLVSQVLVQELLVTERVAWALQLASVCCEMATIANYGAGYLRNAGAIINLAERSSKYVDQLIAAGNQYIPELMKSTATAGLALAYVCEVAMYNHKCGKAGSAARAVRAVQARVLHFYHNADRKDYNCDMELAVGRLMEAQQQLCAGRSDAPAALAAGTALQRHYLATHALGAAWSARHLHTCAIRSRAAGAAARCVRLTRALQLWRRARAAAAAGLPRAPAAAAARLHAALAHTPHTSAAQTRIDNRLRFIAGQPPSSEIGAGVQVFEHTPLVQQHETMLFCVCGLTTTLPARRVSAHVTPPFLRHASCACPACDTPVATLLACEIDALEASVYYRAKEFEIARNYYDGAAETFRLAKRKLNDIIEGYKLKFNRDICDIVRVIYEKEYKNVEMDYLVELSFFELSQNSFDRANENFVKIHELLAENTYDRYVGTDISNLLITAAKLKSDRRIQRHSDADFDEPVPPVEVKTPITKLVKKMETELKIKGDEVPKRLKIIKMNLDAAEESDSETEQEFKVPMSKPIKIEDMTPKPTTKPKLQALGQETPKSPQFHTPAQATPTEQFFTPMTTMKTYSRRIVKNLESEFLTPKAALMSQNYMRETARTRSTVETPLATKSEKSATKSERVVSKTEKLATKLQESASKTEKQTTKTDKLTTKSDRLTTKSDRLTTKSDRLTTKSDKLTTKSDKLTTKSDMLSTKSDKLSTKSEQKNKRPLIRVNSPGKLEERPTTRSRRKANDK